MKHQLRDMSLLAENLSTPELDKLVAIVEKQRYKNLKPLEGRYYINKTHVFKIVKVSKDGWSSIICCPKVPCIDDEKTYIVETFDLYQQSSAILEERLEEAFEITEDIFKNYIHYFINRVIAAVP